MASVALSTDCGLSNRTANVNGPPPNAKQDNAVPFSYFRSQLRYGRMFSSNCGRTHSSLCSNSLSSSFTSSSFTLSRVSKKVKILQPGLLQRASGNGAPGRVFASTARSGNGSSGSSKRPENSGDPPLFAGRMAEFVSKSKRVDAVSGGGTGEPDNAFRMREAIMQARERILKARQSPAAKAEAAAKATAETASAQTAPKPESVKQTEVPKPAGRARQTESVKKPDPVKPAEPAKASAKAEPKAATSSSRAAPKAKTTRVKQTRAKSATKSAEVEAPRTFISGPDGVVAVVEEASEKKASAPKAKKAVPKAKVTRRKVAASKKGESAEGAEQKEGVSDGAEVSEMVPAVANGAEVSGKVPAVASGVENEGGRKNGAAKVGASVRRKAVVVEEPTLATSALPTRAAAARSAAGRTAAEAFVGGSEGGGSVGVATAVVDRPTTAEMQGEKAEEKAVDSVGKNGHVNGSSAEGKGTTPVAEATPPSEDASVEGTAPAAQKSDSEKSKKADAQPANAPKAAEQKNKYAAKKNEPKKENPKEKLAGIRGGLVDRLLASPKVSTVLAAARMGLDAQSMVRLIRDLSVKETEVKKPGLTAKAFAWLRKFRAPLDPIVYLAAIETFARNADPVAAREALDDMREHKVRPSPEHVAQVITAYRAAGRFREAADVTADLGSDVTPDATIFNGALRACVEGRLGAARVLEVYGRMQAAGVVETADTYVHVIDQCLLAEKDRPGVGWVAENVREKGFNLDRVGARAVEKLLGEKKVDEAWERFINWKPAKGRWSGVLYERMLDGLLTRGFVEDVGLHVSEMERHKIFVPADLWERVQKLTNPTGTPTPPPGTVSPPSSLNPPSSAATSQRNESGLNTTRAAPGASESGVKGPLQALSESLVKKATSPGFKPRAPAAAASSPVDSSRAETTAPDRPLMMKEVWTPKGKFFTAPRVVPPSEEGVDLGGANPPARASGLADRLVQKAGVAVSGGQFAGISKGRAAVESVSSSDAGGEDVSGELAPYWKLIQVQIRKGKLEGAAETLDDVQQLGLVPTAGMFKVVVGACGKAGLKDTAWNLIRQMQEAGHIPTPDLFEALR